MFLDYYNNILLKTKSIDNIFTNMTAKVYVSAGNVNDYNLISNNYRLTYTNKIEYPSVIPNIINGTYGDTLYNMTVVMAGVNTYLTNILDDVYLELNSGETSILGLNAFKSNEFFSTIVNYDFFPNISKYYYFENYIPFSIDTSNRTFEILELYIKSGNRILLQEITVDGSIYQHYINISVVNFIVKIISDNKFHNINDSFFYINNTIPCIITTNRRIPIGKHIFWDWEDDELTKV